MTMGNPTSKHLIENKERVIIAKLDKETKEEIDSLIHLNIPLMPDIGSEKEDDELQVIDKNTDIDKTTDETKNETTGQTTMKSTLSENATDKGQIWKIKTEQE